MATSMQDWDAMHKAMQGDFGPDKAATRQALERCAAHATAQERPQKGIAMHLISTAVEALAASETYELAHQLPWPGIEITARQLIEKLDAI